MFENVVNSIREHLLLIESCILICVALTYWLEDRGPKIFTKILNMLMLVLMAGMPIVYTSITRSVFEVNKLLLLRLVLLIGCGVWATRNILLSTQGDDVKDGDSDSNILGLRWKWMGLEYAFLVWLIINTLATIFSQNFSVSIIGAYDRWEGIITVVNYVFLFWMFAQLVRTTKTVYWLLGGMLVPTVLSAIYGIFQSFGVDFMRWSVDPTHRVFASINNPVHFSAYVGMLVPVGLGFLLHLWSLGKDKDSLKLHILKWVVFVSTFLCYYAWFLSFSRAAGLGLVAALTIFYLFSFDLFSTKSKKMFVFDFLLTVVFLGVLYINYFFSMFKHDSAGLYVILGSLLFLAVYSILQIVLFYGRDRFREGFFRHFAGMMLLVGAFFADDKFISYFSGDFLSSYGLWGKIGVILLLCGAFGYIFQNLKSRDGFHNKLLMKLLIVYAFCRLLFVVNGWLAIAIYLGFILLIYILEHKELQINWSKATKFFTVVVFLPLLISFILHIALIHTDIISAELGILIMNFVFLLSSSTYIFVFSKDDAQTEKLHYMIAFLVLLAVIVFVPTMPGRITELIQAPAAQNEQFSSAEMVEWKVSLYENVAIGGQSARMSMWKSCVPWFEDNWWLGTGPDTIKELYSKYRREDYGILEGGHNFTPDRVHNEYLNTLVTIGLFGFVVRWIWIVGGFLVIVTACLYGNMASPFFYLLIGTTCGAMVHMGQLFFNFSVVATAVLYSALMGMALAIGRRRLGDPLAVEEEVSKGKQKKEQRFSNVFFEGAFNASKVDALAWLKIAITWIVVLVFIYNPFYNPETRHKEIFKALQNNSFTSKVQVLLKSPLDAISPWLAERHYREGFNFFMAKNYRPAIAELTQACQFAPLESQYKSELGRALEDYAETQKDMGERLKTLQKAEEVYKQTVMLSPLNPWYINRLANVYIQYYNLYNDPELKKMYLSLAGELLKQASIVDKNNPLFQMSYGVFLHRVGQLDGAKKYYQRVLQIDDRMNEARLNLGDIYQRQHNVTATIEEYQKVLDTAAKNPNKPVPAGIYDNLGKIYFDQRKFDQAIYYFEKALLISPRDPVLLRNLGVTYHQQRNWRRAIDVYKRALSIDSNDVITRKYLAFSYYTAGDLENAVEELGILINQTPDDMDIRRNLEIIKKQLADKKK